MDVGDIKSNNVNHDTSTNTRIYEAGSGNDTNTICKCGHSGFEHENGDNDHICKSCNCCWSFKQAAAVPAFVVPPKTSTPADRQNSVGAQQQLPSGNDEQKFAPYFADANRQIDELESEANGKKSQIDSDLLKSKIEIVKDLAQKIEKEGFPIERIANEIVHQLKGRISPTHIRDNLEDRYKDRRQSSNAKKRKVATVVLPTDQHSQQPLAKEDLDANKVATVVPAEITVCVDGHETTDIGRGDLANKQDIATSHHEYTVPITKQLSQQQKQQGHIRVLIDWDELSDKMAEFHYKDINNFWLCGQVENDKLIDIVLEREQPQVED
jgi:hypothetical protein